MRISQDTPARHENSATGRSLRWQFAAALLLAGLLPALILATINAAGDYRNQRRNLQERLDVSATATGHSIDEFVEAHLAGVALAADLHSPARDWQGTLDQLRARYPTFVTALVTDASGQILAASPRFTGSLQGESVADRSYFSTPRATGQPHVSNAFRGRLLSNRSPLIAVAAPVMQGDTFLGVVQGSIQVDAFTELRTRAMRSRSIEMLILDRNHRVIHSSDGLPYRFLDSALSSDPGKDLCDLRGGTRLQRGVLRNGGDAWSACARLERGWKLVLLSPDSLLLSSVRTRFASLVGVLALSLFGVLVAFLWQMASLRRGMLGLSASLQSLVSGEQNAVAAQPLPREFLPLARRISSLAGELDRANHDLLQSLEEQSALARSLRETVDRREQEIDDRTAELTAANSELDRMNRTDPLTGCLNRRGLQHFLIKSVDEMGLLVKPMRAIAIDVDYFKTYNDLHGHAAGDNALLAVASATMSVVDSLGGCLTRMGGEEFVALVPAREDTPLDSEGEAIRKTVEALAIRHAKGPRGILTVSVGVAQGGRGDDCARTLMAADEALYKAKSRGRNRVAVDDD